MTRAIIVTVLSVSGICGHCFALDASATSRTEVTASVTVLDREGGPLELTLKIVNNDKNEITILQPKFGYTYSGISMNMFRIDDGSRRQSSIAHANSMQEHVAVGYSYLKEKINPGSEIVVKCNLRSYFDLSAVSGTCVLYIEVNINGKWVPAVSRFELREDKATIEKVISAVLPDELSNAIWSYGSQSEPKMATHRICVRTKDDNRYKLVYDEKVPGFPGSLILYEGDDELTQVEIAYCDRHLISKEGPQKWYTTGLRLMAGPIIDLRDEQFANYVTHCDYVVAACIRKNKLIVYTVGQYYPIPTEKLKSTEVLFPRTICTGRVIAEGVSIIIQIANTNGLATITCSLIDGGNQDITVDETGVDVSSTARANRKER